MPKHLVFVAALVALVVAPSACRHTPTAPIGECRSDADCGGETPFCTPVVDTCSQCYRDDQCSCHEICNANVCVPLGADDEAQSTNAHGNWLGKPGEASYTFVDLCQSDDDCDIGELCNPLTGGCLVAADYQTSCTLNPSCPAGPNGEYLVCEPITKRCLPAGRCTADYNCCGATSIHPPNGEFRCDPSLSVCRPPANDCDPPTELTSSCPQQPKASNGCDGGLFCTPLGECVQCTCDADCQGGLVCYQQRRVCVSVGYCERSTDCDPGQSCDTRAALCKSTCGKDEDCSDPHNYCYTLDHVCRPRTELPCQADLYDTPSNNTPEDALGNSVALPLPALGGSTTVTDLSLCVGDVDWYTIALNKGDHVVVQGSSLTSLHADIKAYGGDAITALAVGSINDAGPAPLAFTANYDDIYYLAVTPQNASSGTYQLTITLTQGTACTDTFEDTNGTNNLPSDATVLGAPVPSGCTGTSNQITCSGGVLSLCVGDVDYYLVDVPAGGDLALGISFSSNLDLYAYGPFATPETATPDEAMLAAESISGVGSSESIAITSRLGGYYLVRVVLAASLETPYDLQATVTPPTVSCDEDNYDAIGAATGGSDPLPPSVQDDAGLNDDFFTASWIGLRQGTVGVDPVGVTLVENGDTTPLTLCRADEDWFRLGIEGGSGLVDLPAGKRLVLEVQLDAASPGSAVTMGIGHSGASWPFGSVDVGTPTKRVVVGLTDGEPYFVRILGASDATSPVYYRLHVELEEPPICSDDGLGDSGASRNDTPATATALSTTDGWPSAADQSYTLDSGILSLCASDNDWYSYDIPAGTRLIARVGFDPDVAEVGLALYDDTVGTLTDGPQPSPLTTGLIEASELAGRGYQRVTGGSDGSTVYLQVYNLTGWPLANYTLELRLVPAACFADEAESNDTYQAAHPLTLNRNLSGGPDSLMLDALTVCGAGDTHADWYAVGLERGDTIEASVYYTPNEADLDLYLFAYDAPGISLSSDYDDDPPQKGVLTVNYTVGPGDTVGDYLLNVSPFGVTSNNALYGMEVRVWRACVDDNWETVDPLAPYDVTFPVTRSEPLVLCNDTDMFRFDVSSTQDITACADFVHANGDIDLILYDTTNPSSPVVAGTSATKNDHEQITVPSASGQYVLKVYLDPRDQVNTTYTLNIVSGSSCP